MRTPNRLVFLNCPFDSEFKPLFEAIVFAVYACNYVPRCALEVIDSGDNRLTKILDLIDLCDSSVHDLSRTELNPNGLPRFNMPFELGLTFGRKHSRRGRNSGKLLVLDRKPHRYLEFISDLRGCDPVAHGDNPHAAITQIRDWLSSCQKEPLNGPKHLIKWFDWFSEDLPRICEAWGLDRNSMAFNDIVWTIHYWIDANLPV